MNKYCPGCFSRKLEQTVDAVESMESEFDKVDWQKIRDDLDHRKEIYGQISRGLEKLDPKILKANEYNDIKAKAYYLLAIIYHYHCLGANSFDYEDFQVSGVDASIVMQKYDRFVTFYHKELSSNLRKKHIYRIKHVLAHKLALLYGCKGVLSANEMYENAMKNSSYKLLTKFHLKNVMVKIVFDRMKSEHKSGYTLVKYAHKLNKENYKTTQKETESFGKEEKMEALRNMMVTTSMQLEVGLKGIENTPKQVKLEALKAELDYVRQKVNLHWKEMPTGNKDSAQTLRFLSMQALALVKKLENVQEITNISKDIVKWLNVETTGPKNLSM